MSPGNHGTAGSTAGNSLDWAGYAVTGATFSSVAGQWTQPAATCPTNKLQEAAFWVGIDGYSAADPTVEQIGTDADCTKAKGKKPGGPSYYAWYEMYPSNFVELSNSQYPVAPNDVLTSSVTVSGLSYTLSITNGSRWHFSTVQTVAAPLQNVSAEWIAESPSTCTGTQCKVLPLADFGSTTFSGASANGLPISSSSFTAQQIKMTTKNGKTTRALASPLNSGGNGFAVAWASN